jgi:hypothetical protein
MRNLQPVRRVRSLLETRRCNLAHLPPNKPSRLLADYAHFMEREADLAEGAAEALAQAGVKAQADGEKVRADAIWFACRKVRVKGLLHRARAAGARAHASHSERS